MSFAGLKEHLLSTPEVRDWPELAELLERTIQPRPAASWEYLQAACQAAGGDEEKALPGAMAICCLHLSIVLVDDMLDEDSKGEYQRLGMAKTANLSQALQAIACDIVHRAGLDAERTNAIQRNLIETALSTAFGQNLDVSNPETEEDYWRIVEAKSTPLPAATLYIGSLLGGASFAAAEQLRRFGGLLGKMVQINDDLADALHPERSPDWNRRTNNLPILFALTVDHPERSHFVRLLDRISDPEILQEAQSVLVSSGAVSYCAHLLSNFHHSGQQLIGEISVSNPRPLKQLLADQIGPIRKIFASVHLDLPIEI